MSRMIHSGMLNRRVTFRRAVVSQDELGGVSRIWQDVRTVWAYVSRNAASEVAVRDTHTEQVRLTVIIRTQDSISEGMQCVLSGDVYYVQWVAPYGDNIAFLECRVARGGEYDSYE